MPKRRFPASHRSKKGGSCPDTPIRDDCENQPIVTDDEVVRSYIRYATGRRDDDAELANETMARVVSEEPSFALRLLAEVIAGLDDESVICLVGAGDLENLVGRHGVSLWSEIDAAARASRKFAIALSCVWAWDSPVSDRLDALLAELGIERS
jgi:hypothetical protein